MEQKWEIPKNVAVLKLPMANFARVCVVSTVSTGSIRTEAARGR